MPNERTEEIADALAELVRGAYRLAATQQEPPKEPATHQSSALMMRDAEMRGATREYERHVRERVAPVITAALAWYDHERGITRDNASNALPPLARALYDACAAVRRSGLQPQEIDHAIGLEVRT